MTLADTPNYPTHPTVPHLDTPFVLGISSRNRDSSKFKSKGGGAGLKSPAPPRPPLRHARLHPSRDDGQVRGQRARRASATARAAVCAKRVDLLSTSARGSHLLFCDSVDTSFSLRRISRSALNARTRQCVLTQTLLERDPVAFMYRTRTRSGKCPTPLTRNVQSSRCYKDTFFSLFHI